MKHIGTIVIAIFAAMLLSTPVKADPAGLLNVANCSGGGVTITALSVDFAPSGGGNGCIQTGGGTSVTYTGGGPLVPAVQGVIRDVTFGVGFPVVDFMTFAGNPNLHFDLTSLGPGSANTNCAALALGSSCSPTLGSPIILTNLGSSITVSLSAGGLARDLAGSSNWSGSFSTQISGQTAAQIQATLNGGGSITSTHSGTFTLTTVVPEPATMLLLGTGLLGVAAKVRKRRKTSKGEEA